MKYRVIVNGVSFYSTATAIKRGVGDSIAVNAAVRLCAEEMGDSLGLGKTFVFYDNKMNKSSFDVQISKVTK
jgi:hypothetical protein